MCLWYLTREPLRSVGTHCDNARKQNSFMAGFETKPCVDDLRQKQGHKLYTPGIPKESNLWVCQNYSYSTVFVYLRKTPRVKTKLENIWSASK